MLFQILDVGHGFCAVLLTDTNRLILFDCASRSAPDEFHPADYLWNSGFRQVDWLVITNYDEDHISGLPRLRQQFPVQVLERNPTISPPQLRALKLNGGPISLAMQSLLDMIPQYRPGPTQPADVFGMIARSTFFNSYPVDCDTTNNLSLVTFLHYRDVHLVIPGDLDAAGWRCLLRRPDFRAELARVNFFVASHHGREDGYCPEVFQLCRPHLVIFSDGPQTHATQEMANAYAQHATGVYFGQQIRRVLSTRADGPITITQPPTAGCTVQIGHR